jgi:VWFA-related protein
MKKILLILIVLTAVAFILFSQQVDQHAVTVMNVEVSVRVLDGNQFVDDLTMDDFELYEDGVLQKLEAMYLVKKTNIAREEAHTKFYPSLSRHYYLLFQITDYNPKLEEAVDHFINTIIQPGDTLDIWTPVQKYSLSSKALQSLTKEQIASEMKKIIRKDTQVGASYYRELMRDLKMLVRAISSATGAQGPTMTDMESDSTSSMFGLEFLLPRYRETMSKMEGLRLFDQRNLIGFANALKKQQGENFVFYFYQREYRPEISPSLLNKMQSVYQDDSNIMGQLQTAFDFYHRSITFDAEKIREAFADSSILFNFIFMDKTPENISGIHMREQSEDIFKAFSEAAKATGGDIDTSQNPGIGFKNTLNRSDYYYLLYYSPQNYVKDGTFKKIEVKVRNKNYKLAHRQGYFAY